MAVALDAKQKKKKRGIVHSVLLRKSRLFVQTRCARVLTATLKRDTGEMNLMELMRTVKRERERDSRTSQVRCIEVLSLDIRHLNFSSQPKVNVIYCTSISPIFLDPTENRSFSREHNL